MFEFTKDLIHRAWLTEDINGEHTLVEVEFRNYDKTTEKFLAQVKRHDKLPNGEYESFEIGTTYECTVDGEKAYFVDTAEFYAGAVFTRKKSGKYTRRDELGYGTATILDKNAKFYVSHMLRETIFRQVPEFVRAEKSFADATDDQKRAQIKKIQEYIRATTYKNFMENELERNRIQEQKKEDVYMLQHFPNQWIPEYTPQF